MGFPNKGKENIHWFRCCTKTDGKTMVMKIMIRYSTCSLEWYRAGSAVIFTSNDYSSHTISVCQTNFLVCKNECQLDRQHELGTWG